MLGTVLVVLLVDVARCTPHLAPQPELGLLPEQRTGLGSGHSGCPTSAGQDLSRRGANSGAPRIIGTPCRVPVVPLGEGSRADRELAVPELRNR